MGSRTASSSRVVAILGVVVASLATGGGASSAPARPFTACLVTAAPRTNDAALDAEALAGVRETELDGVKAQLVRSTSTATYAASLRSCARAEAGLVIAVGVSMADAVDTVASEFPRTRFAILNVSVESLALRPPNVVGLLFREEEAGYLVGYAAGLWAERVGGRAVGSVGGIEIPPVDRFIAGFQFGAKRADPDVTTLTDYAQTFTVRSACRRKALDQIARGSVVEFQVADACGLGVFDAARAKHVVGIGFEADQSAVGPWVLTSAVEHANVAVRTAIADARAGTLRSARNISFGARHGGVGYGAWSPRVSTAIRAAVAKQYELLVAGKITDIPTRPGG